MTRAETIYDAGGRPIGRVVQHSETGAVAFKPAEGVQGPPARLYKNVDELKAVLFQLYGDPRAKR